MNVSHATSLWTLGAFVALSAAACAEVDHTVGAGAEDEALDAPGAGGNGASGGDNGAAGSDDAEGAGGIWENGSTTTVSGRDVAAPSVSTVGTTGSDHGTGGTGTGTGGAGTGGEVSVNSSNGGDLAAAGEKDGGLASEGAWGDLPIPDSCTEVSHFQVSEISTECDLEVDCEGTPMFSHCMEFEDFWECWCGSVPDVEFHLTGVTLADACPHTLAACLNWPELESGQLECLPPEIFNGSDSEIGPDYCIDRRSCTREGVVGNADVTASYDEVTGCTGDSAGWVCGCDPSSVWFRLPTATDPPCLDRRDWCTGVGVEPIGNRTCTLTEQSGQGEFGCSADVECERAVTVSGQEATMYEDERVYCILGGNNDGHYECSCSELGPYTETIAEDLPSACATAVSLCEGE